MDATLAKLATHPDFWLIAFVIALALLCAIFYGFSLLWEKRRPSPLLQRQLQQENECLRKENAHLRRLIKIAERHTLDEIDRLRITLGLSR